jgi:hypothetical protein
MIDALLPRDEGVIWAPKTDGDLDKLLDGIADSGDLVIADLAKLADIRNPYKTNMLDDLEVEYGIRPSTKKTEAERRAGLAAVITGGEIDGSIDTLQDKLDQAGFNVTVYANDPPANPDDIITGLVPPTMCGSADAICGGVDVVCGGVDDAFLIVNGESFGDDSYFSVPDGDWHQTTSCGDPSTPVCGAASPTCGGYYLANSYWVMMFFAGGSAEYDGEGVVTSINAAEVPRVRKDELKQMILKYKPMHAWGILVVSFT